jgi:hypothetical protein
MIVEGKSQVNNDIAGVIAQQIECMARESLRYMRSVRALEIRCGEELGRRCKYTLKVTALS